MKLILSRKGFDSGSGGGPSPILPDGTMVSLPIPEPLGQLGGACAYRDIGVNNQWTMESLATTLGVKPSNLENGAHLDPDLVPQARPRQPGWKASFGQSGAASGHLTNQAVGVGDLFIFWGLFRHTIYQDGNLRWDNAREPFHAVFGWLQVEQQIDPSAHAAPAWAHDHPHVAVPWRKSNQLYIARTNGPFGLRGAGVLNWRPELQLTCPASPKTLWRLPENCHPDSTGATLSYHSDTTRWTKQSGSTLLQTVARGQEFVVDATPAWLDWAKSLLTSSAS
jgi:hypothetical protein